MRLVTDEPSGSRLGDFLKTGLTSDATSFRGAAAFVRASALAHIQPLIRDFSATKSFELVVGIDLQGTSIEGLQMLLDALGGNGRAFVFHNPGPNTFHPKLYRFGYADRTELYVGSGNLTSGGLFTNHEAGLQLTVKESTPGGPELLQQIDDALDRWSVNAGGAAKALSADLIKALSDRGLIAPEAVLKAATASISKGAASTGNGGGGQGPLFASISVANAPAPLVQTPTSAATVGSAGGATPAGASPTPLVATPPDPSPDTAAGAQTAGGVPRFFVMTLQRTDVGSGQTTVGAARRSPEIFIPLAARDLKPEFWGWPDQFDEDTSRPGKFDRIGVPFFVNGQYADVNMMTWPVKHDFRLRSETLRSAGDIGDILRLERSGAPGIAYVATVIPKASAEHAALLDRCDHPVRNSLKRFGYY